MLLRSANRVIPPTQINSARRIETSGRLSHQYRNGHACRGSKSQPCLLNDRINTRQCTSLDYLEILRRDIVFGVACVEHKRFRYGSYAVHQRHAQRDRFALIVLDSVNQTADLEYRLREVVHHVNDRLPVGIGSSQSSYHALQYGVIPTAIFITRARARMRAPEKDQSTLVHDHTVW